MILSEIEIFSFGKLGILFALGVAVIGGTVGGRLFRRLHVPQVIAYLLIGLLIGESGLNLLSVSDFGEVNLLDYFALGIIGFMIGGELKAESFKKYGRQFITIMLSEGIGAFLLVGGLVFAFSMLFTNDIKLSAAMAVVLGAISSATDPASTVQVLWEYKTRGALTTAAIAIVALDDALALTLYAIGTSLAGVLTGHEEHGVTLAVLYAVYELAFAILVGFAAGFGLKWMLKRMRERDNEITFAVGTVLLVIGASLLLNLDVILASMMLGLTLVNTAPRRSRDTFDVVKRFSPPIYVLFFVMAGARLKVADLSFWAWTLVASYVLGRTIGKISGAYLGAALSNAVAAVKRYLGMCLFAQGGVAIGLSIVASRRFEDEISSMVVLVVAATTFIVQILGPLFIKTGVKKAGEIGMNVTEEDLLGVYNVKDVMNAKPVSLYEGASLREVVRTVGNTKSYYYPVVDNDGNLTSCVTFDGLRNTFATQEINDWLVTLDIAEPVIARVTPDVPLSSALELSMSRGVEYLPVVSSSEDMHLDGILEIRSVKRQLSAEVLSRQQKADSAHIPKKP